MTARGRTRWLRLVGEAERDADGRVRGIRGACQDITDTRRAAGRTRRQARQLTNMLERLTDGFFTLDRHWRFTCLNPEVQRLVGRPREELVGRRITDECPAPGAGGFLAHYRRALDDNAVVQTEKYHAPLELWVQLKIHPSAEGVAVYVRDITKRVRWRQQLLQLNAQLDARVQERTAQLEIANSELEAFSYAIAHDLRAPLGAIHGFGECLQRLAGPALDDRGRHYLQRIEVGRLDGSHAAHFVRDNGAGFDEAWAGKPFEPFQRLHTQGIRGHGHRAGNRAQGGAAARRPRVGRVCCGRRGHVLLHARLRACRRPDCQSVDNARDLSTHDFP